MPFRIVMAGLVPAIHVLANRKKGVDARIKPGHDESVGQLKPRRKSATHVTRTCGATRCSVVTELASTAAEVRSLPLKSRLRRGVGVGA